MKKQKVIVNHLLGNIADWVKLKKIADKYNLILQSGVPIQLDIK